MLVNGKSLERKVFLKKFYKNHFRQFCFQSEPEVKGVFLFTTKSAPLVNREKTPAWCYTITRLLHIVEYASKIIIMIVTIKFRDNKSV